MAGTITIADEIKEAAGPEMSARLSSDLVGEFKCVACDMEGSTLKGDDVSVILFEHLNGAVYRVAHAQCAPSQIVPVGEPITPPSETTSDVHSFCTYMDDERGRAIATLVIEQSAGVAFFTENGDLLSPWFAGVMDAGWQLVLDQTENPKKAWGASLKTNAAQRQGVLSAGKLIILDQLPKGPGMDQWLTAAIAAREVRVYVGTGIGLEQNPGKPIEDLLQNAISAGNLAAARVTVVNKNVAPPDRTREQEAAANVAGLLQQVIAERARPGTSQGKFNSLPDAVPFPARPTLSTVTAGDYAMLVIDLNTPPEMAAQATQALAGLRRAGMKPFTSWTAGPLAVAPEGWGYLLWKSQVLILAGNDKKLLFEPMAPAPGWYQAVGKQGNLGVLVTNLHRRPEDNPDEYRAAIDAAMERGEVVACAVLGMNVS